LSYGNPGPPQIKRRGLSEKAGRAKGGFMMKKRIRYTFTGFVQGVGFRYRAYHAANSLGLTGWVRNEPDGSVTMEVQGTDAGIREMLEMIENSHFIEIENSHSEDLPVRAAELSFEIRD
jgi:acylphosphatase